MQKQMVPTITFDQGTLCVPMQFANQLQKVAPWAQDKRSDCLRCDAMHYPDILRSGMNFKDEVPQWLLPSFKKANISTLRPYQIDAIEAWLPQKRGLIVMPTGTGKTEVALSILHQLGVSTLIICPLRVLMHQWQDRLKNAFGCKIGIIGDTHHHLEPITVTTYKSACIHMKSLGNRFQLLIFDECHHLSGKVLCDSARMSAAPFRLGLTATPERHDDNEAVYDQLIGPRAYTLLLSQVPQSALAAYTVKRITVELNEDESKRHSALGKTITQFISKGRQKNPNFTFENALKENSSDLETRRSAKALRQRKAIEERAHNKLLILEELLGYHIDSQIIIFTGSNSVAYDLSLRFLIPCLLDHCDSDEREFILQNFKDGKFKAIIANQVLDEGIDIIVAKVAIVIGGNASVKQAKQRLGRILRRSGDAPAILYEIICQGTGEEQRSRQRRKSDAYQTRRHLPST